MLLDQSGEGQVKQGKVGNDDHSIPAAITDTGCERELNEDRYAVIESPSGLAWLVCDGMGGQAGGELAAQLAIDGIRRDLENLPWRTCMSALKSAVLEANRIIVLRRQNQAFAQMGTTLVGLLFSGVEVSLAHVGDSRAYLVRDGVMEQLTTDHTYVQELVNSGQIRPEEALSHPQAHILTRAIGSEPGLQVDMQKYWMWETAKDQSNDILVLCTDGLYSHVTDEEIASWVTDMSPQQACVKLVESAKDRGGYDNITVAVIPIGGQLRDKPPEGYNEEAVHKKLRAKHNPTTEKKTSNGSFLRTLIAVVVFSALSALLVVLWLLFSLSQ